MSVQKRYFFTLFKRYPNNNQLRRFKYLQNINRIYIVNPIKDNFVLNGEDDFTDIDEDSYYENIIDEDVKCHRRKKRRKLMKEKRSLFVTSDSEETEYEFTDDEKRDKFITKYIN